MRYIFYNLLNTSLTLFIINSLTSALTTCRHNILPPRLCTPGAGCKDPRKYIALFCVTMHQLFCVGSFYEHMEVIYTIIHARAKLRVKLDTSSFHAVCLRNVLTLTDCFIKQLADRLIKRSTSTVALRDGGFLIAFLAWFVGVAGSAFWDILSSVMFLSRATELPRDALFYQQQMSLRAGVSGVGTLCNFWMLGRQ